MGLFSRKPPKPSCDPELFSVLVFATTADRSTAKQLIIGSGPRYQHRPAGLLVSTAALPRVERLGLPPHRVRYAEPHEVEGMSENLARIMGGC